MEQTTLADLVTEQAIRQVAQHAEPEWLALADTTLRRVCLQQEFFTTDDLWAAGLPAPREPRAMGAVLRRAKADGLVAPTDTYLRSDRAVAHRNPKRLWRSLTWAGAR